jgi:hypothetical protein
MPSILICEGGIMDEEQLKILELVANKTITPEEGAKLLEEKKEEQIPVSYKEVITADSLKIEEKDYENEEQIDVTLELGVTNFKLQKGPSEKLYRVEYGEEEGFSHHVIFAHKELQVSNDLKKPSRFDLSSLKKFVDPSTKKCFIELNPDVKLFLKVKFGGGKADLDFSGLKVKRLRLSSGASDTKVAFNTLNTEVLDYLKIESGASNINLSGLGNTNCTEMDISLGACTATLDFSGEITQDMYTEISLRVGRLNLLVPKDLGVKIKADDRLADMKLPDFSVRDGYRISKNLDEAKYVLNLRIDSTLAQVNLNWA